MGREGKRYSIIYADPPWHYRTWSDKGNGRSAENHYSTQSAEYLRDMDVSSVCRKDCTLLMWATFPCLQQALDLGKYWGFTYKTVAFTWVKKNVKNERLFVGMGYYTRSNAEIVLLFTKGRPLARRTKNVPQVLISPRSRHSEKPDEIRDRIVSLFGDVPRLELFARDKAGSSTEDPFAGWDVFGNEVRNSIII